ncbi:MAG: hypothetical protein ACREQN_01875 [Candidatus Binataceae bacterium]
MATSKEHGETDATLRAMGFDPSASPEERIAKLTALRGQPNVSDAALARELGKIALGEAVAVLTELAIGASGATRREIRRALFKLRQRGFEAAPLTDTAAPTAPVASEPGVSAMLSPADGEGARVAWLLKSRHGAGGLKRLWALVSENQGLVGVSLGTLSRKELRAERAELERRAGVPLTDADWRLVDFIMCEAYRRTPPTHRHSVGNFLALRAELVAAAPPAKLVHPVYQELAAAALAEPSPDLMKEPEIAAWKFPTAAAKVYADEVTSLRQSVIVLNRALQEERINTVVERAIDEQLAGDSGHRLRRHLEDTAYYFARTGRKSQAGWAVAAAVRMRDGADLRHVAFFQLLVRAQLGAVLAEEQEKQQEEPRLIMTPAEAMRARQAARARIRSHGR